MADVTEHGPRTELQQRFSSEGATATPWADVQDRLAGAEIWWLSTVRPDGRPHVTPLIAVWVDGALHFCTGPDERKALNLAENPHCVLTTGGNQLHAGFDLVMEGDAIRVVDGEGLHRVAEAFESKYGSERHFDVGDGVFLQEGSAAVVFEVRPIKAWGIGRERLYSATRWKF